MLFRSELGVGNLLGLFQLGTLPTHLARKNMTLFAELVLPTLRRELPAEPAELQTA